MERIYLKNLEANRTIGPQTVIGISEAEIADYENKLDIKFPRAYKEFLFLAGDDCGRLNLSPGTSSIEDLGGDYRKKLYSRMERYKVDLGRPFWVFTEMDAFEQFLYFYLDEPGDDPLVHRGEMTDEVNFSPIDRTFSKFINTVVDDSILIEKRGYA